MNKPRFRHDCDTCIFLKRYGNHDLYYCPGEHTVVARYGDDGPDYKSGWNAGCEGINSGGGPLAAAVWETVERGLDKSTYQGEADNED